MYCPRSVCRNPNVVRVVSKPSAYARNASFFPAPFIPRALAATHNDFAPLFRIFDDFSQLTTPQFHRGGFTFQPRFDIREVGNNYEVQGELPGIDGKDLEVEFTDPQTLVIRGKADRETKSGNSTAATTSESRATEVAAEAADAVDDNSDAASTYSTGSYQKPTVEDEAGAESASSAAAPTAEVAEASEAPAETKQVKESTEPEQPRSRYWVSERHTGSFQRVFKFPSRVDQEAVKASLRNGILSITVPKAAEPAARRISVE